MYDGHHYSQHYLTVLSNQKSSRVVLAGFRLQWAAMSVTPDGHAERTQMCQQVCLKSARLSISRVQWWILNTSNKRKILAHRRLACVGKGKWQTLVVCFSFMMILDNKTTQIGMVALTAEREEWFSVTRIKGSSTWEHNSNVRTGFTFSCKTLNYTSRT